MRIVDDIISLDVSELSSPITLGNGTATSTTSIGNILIKEHTIDTDLNYSSNSTATIFKLTATDQSEFADALGTSSITVADGSSLNFLWYDADTNETVYGYASENTTNEADNLITADDTFVEIVRISMSEEQLYSLSRHKQLCILVRSPFKIILNPKSVHWKSYTCAENAK